MEVDKESWGDTISWDAFLFSSYCFEPSSWIYGKVFYRLPSPLEPNQFGNASNRLYEVAKRAIAVLATLFALIVLAVPGAIVVLAFSGIGLLFRALGVFAMPGSCIHLQGSLPEKTCEQNIYKVLTWNIRGQPAGGHFTRGGMPHWSSRIDGIVEKIKDADPDIVILQEVTDHLLADRLMRAFEDAYAHFFFQCGASLLGQSAGSFVMTKCGVKDFDVAALKSTSLFENRGFATLEIKQQPQDTTASMRFVTASLSQGLDQQGARTEDFWQIAQYLSKKEKACPTFFAGDTGMDRTNPLESSIADTYLGHSFTGNTVTYDPEFANRWGSRHPPGGSDLLSLFKRQPKDGPCVTTKGVHLKNAWLIPGFTRGDEPPLSDHHGLCAWIQYNREKTPKEVLEKNLPETHKTSQESSGG